MITIFNRVEFLITYNQKEWMRIRDVLDLNHIEYVNRLKTMSHRWAARSESRVGLDESACYEYKIYVKKKDFDKAVRLVNGNW